MTAADWPYLRRSFHLVLAVLLLPLHLNQIRAVIVRNDSEGFGVVPHKYCFMGTFASDSANELVFSQIAFKENRLICFAFIYRSNGIDTDSVESINDRNARKEPVKSDYVPFASQRNAQIKDGLFGTSTRLSSVVFTLSLALIDFECVSVAFTVASAKDFEATFHRLVLHPLPYR
jgi:hypothetical protein